MNCSENLANKTKRLFRHCKVPLILAAIVCLLSCGDKEFLEDALNDRSGSGIDIVSGDLIIVAGGNVLRTATPFPLHEIHVYSKDGLYKGLLHRASDTEMIMGIDLNFTDTGIVFTTDTIDRVSSILFAEQSFVTDYILDAGLTGNTLRSVAVLSDGGTVVAESTTSIEKFDSSGVRVTTNFPFTVTATIQKLKAISNGRFAVMFTGGNDSVSIRNNDGTVNATVASGLACTTNCDPTDILELPDGRFLISYQINSIEAIELYSSTFVRIGTFFQNTTLLQDISAMALMDNGDVLACSTLFNVCERLAISGNIGTRVGTSAFIDDASRVRQPTDVVVVP